MEKVKAWFLLCCLCLIATGCSSSAKESSIRENSEVLLEKQEDGKQEKTDKIDEVTTDEVEASTNSHSTDDPYSEFLEGRGVIFFDYYMSNIFKDTEYLSYVDEVISYVPSDRGYTISELTDKFNEIFHSEDTFFADADVSAVEYAYIDCGKDGTRELALRLVGPFVEPESELTLIAMELDDRLEVVYAYATWSRSYTAINEYGFITGDGSNGASNHGWDTAYIDADGKYWYGYYEELEYDFDTFIHFKDHDEYDLSNLEGNIMTYSLRLEEYSEDTPEAEYYTFEVSTKDTYQDMDVPNLYTDSPYKDAVDSVHGCKFVSMEEFKKIEDNKLKSIGVTDEIKSGAEPVYKALPISDSDNSTGSAAAEIGDRTVEQSSESSMENYLADEWLYPNGASLVLDDMKNWKLYDDSGNWLFEGTYDYHSEKDVTSVQLYSEVGDTGNNVIAEGTMHYDQTGYLVLDIEFVHGLTEFTDGRAILSRKVK